MASPHFFVSHKELAHDFVSMWKFGGIHPIIPISMMVSLPLFELAILKWWKSRDKAYLVHEFVNNLDLLKSSEK